ncbi:methyltransferase domain-containing protein [Myxococcaceae bacterium JPH2]|nr:methyltransferase domain-containing protein [Myxococcaceae bacterium JPH2]
MTYLMESDSEARRLLEQERSSPSLERLRVTGLRPGAVVLDAGCGPGAITASLVKMVGPEGRVVALDPSESRLEEAARVLHGNDNVELICAALPQAGLPASIAQTGLPSDHFDYTWCQYVFEYLRDPETALDELIRVTRPGGKVVVADIDGVGLLNWPFPALLRDGTEKLMRALSEQGLDLNVGRKLYHLFRQHGLRDVRVHLSPFYVVGGRADDAMVADWSLRFDVLKPVGVPALGGEAAYTLFRDAFLEMLRDEETFKYAVVLTTEGTKP